MKRCPTEAIRVRDGKATIISERCIDCGECIRICHNRAKKAVCDDFSQIEAYKWKIAMPPPSFYGQFADIDDINMILTALKRIGFDDIFEVSRAAELVSHLTRKNFETVKKGVRGPVISSACSAIVRLIRVRFPALCENVLPVNEPFHLAAQMAKEEAAAKTGLRPEEIGVFFLSPCPAKVTSAKAPIGIERSHIDGVLSVSDVYIKMLSALKKIDEPENLMQSGIVGINWATSGGECAGLLTDNYLSADGIENAIKVLEEIEDEKLNDIDFVELNACPGGCVGGVLNMANAFVARSRIKTLRKYLPLTQNRLSGEDDDKRMFWEEALQYEAIYKLDDDMGAAMEKMKKINDIERSLPGLDCGSCGAPSCRAFAEDIVCGNADKRDCIIRFREDISMLAKLGVNLSTILPAPFRQKAERRQSEENANDDT
ncbi:MAG: ferredoxin [Clostridiales bacterium]|nr:MAG: ferredoxin [Clostridiales bacterium]